LADGTITVAFRRWKRPTVKAGSTLRSPVGLLAIDEVQPIDVGEVTDEDAIAAGHRDRDEALAAVALEGHLYRIRFRWLGQDPRVELRQRTNLDDTEFAELVRVVSRLDWALSTLRLIGAQPAVVSTDLAARLGVERAHFKQRVRRLKALGLTESLEIGYRLAPRGEALLARLTPSELVDAVDEGVDQD
jgi:hypothetical protein